MPPIHRKLSLIYPDTTTNESISLTNWHSVQRHKHKVKSAKNAILFHQHFCQYFTAYFKKELSNGVPYFNTFLPN